MQPLDGRKLKKLNCWIVGWVVALIAVPVTGALIAVGASGWLGGVVQASLLDLEIEADDATILFWITALIFLPTVYALTRVILRLKKKINALPPKQPYQQRRILRHMQKIAGVQALIGLAFITIVIQMRVGAVEEWFLTLSVLWTGAALFYFVAYAYQLQIEEDARPTVY